MAQVIAHDLGTPPPMNKQSSNGFFWVAESSKIPSFSKRIDPPANPSDLSRAQHPVLPLPLRLQPPCLTIPLFPVQHAGTGPRVLS